MQRKNIFLMTKEKIIQFGEQVAQTLTIKCVEKGSEDPRVSTEHTHIQIVSTKEIYHPGGGMKVGAASGPAKTSAGVFAGVVFEEKRGKSVLR